LIYEYHVCSARAILYILENFPEINICLDLGHLNIAIFQDAFGMDLDSFIEKAKNRVVHIHIHNNDGRSDSHCGINNGIFKWEDVLSNLPNVEKVILEVRDFKEAIESREILREFFSN
jgi:sugar phosphate isomerase/epimerase